MMKIWLNKAIALLLATVLTFEPVILHAGEIVPSLPDNASRPRVDQSYNGTTVLNIATPNAAGVSHDVYSRFIADDLILNNSPTNVSTRLGGWVEGNPNLKIGGSANLWIGEVTGTSATELNGILEVAGPRMDVVLANEQGITCKGCGFLNTGRATLTTGVPRLGSNGALQGFDVRQGTVTITGTGLNPEARLGLGDTSRVDVLARATQIYARMRADQLNVVTGANAVNYNWSYDPATGAVTGVSPIAGTGAAPALAVDTSALGGMYANAIQLVATENGVGVRMNGEMAASGNLALSSKGRLSLGSGTAGIKAGHKVYVRAAGPVQLDGAVTSEQGDLVDIRSASGTLAVNGQITGGTVELESVGPEAISGAIAASSSLKITSTSDRVTIASTAALKAPAVTLEAAGLADLRGGVNGTSTLTVIGADIAVAGTGKVSGSTATLSAQTSITNSGLITAGRDLTLKAPTVTNASAIAVGRNLSIYGDTIRNDAGSIWANGNITLARNVALDLATLNAATLVENRNGRIEAFQGDLVIRANQVLNTGTAPTIAQTAISRWVEQAAAPPLDPAGEIVKLIDPIYLDANKKILPAYKGAYAELWSSLLGNGTLSASAKSILKPAAIASNGTSLVTDFGAVWSAMRNRANEAGTASAAQALRDLVISTAFDANGAIKPEFTDAYVELWETLATGGTTVSDSVKAILRNSALQPTGTTDPVSGDPLYSNKLVSSAPALWSSMKDASSGTYYTIVKILYKDLFNADGKLAEMIAGHDIDIRATAVRNTFANLSAAHNVMLTAGSVENKALGATEVLFEVHKKPNCFTCHQGQLNFADTFGGRIEANGSVSITGSLSNETVRSSDPSTQDMVAKLNAFIAARIAAGDPDMAGVPLITSKNSEVQENRTNVASIPVSGNGANVRKVGSTDNSAKAAETPSAPAINATTPVSALVAAGLTTLAETDPEFTDYANFITSNYMMAEDRLGYRDDLIANGREAAATAFSRAREKVANETRLPNSPVQVPASDGSGLRTVYPATASLSLKPGGALIAGKTVTVTGASVSNSGALKASDSLSVTAASITGKNGTFSAEKGEVALSSLGSIALQGGGISGGSVKITAGQDFTGKGISIRSAGNASLMAMGNATITSQATTYSFNRGKGVQTTTDQLTSAIDVKGDLSLVAMGDLTLAGVDGRAGGKIDLSAGKDLNLLAVESVSEFHSKEKRSSLDIYSLTSHATSLVAGGNLTALSSGDALLVGTKVKAGGAVDIGASGNLVMAAAQDVETYASQSTKGGFFYKKTTSVSKTEVKNSGVDISAAGDISLTAETGDLVSAGARFSSTGGNIDLAAIEGDVKAGAYTDIFESRSYSKRSILGGLFSSTSSNNTASRINTGTAALSALDLSLVSGEDTSLIGATLSAGKRLSVKTGGDLSIEAAIDSQRRELFSQNIGLITMTTITENSYKETAKLSSFAAGAGYAFDIGGKTSLTLYDYAGKDAANPADLYPQQLLAIKGLLLLKQSLADDYFYDKQVALSPAFKALVSLAVGSFVVPGLFSAIGFTANSLSGVLGQTLANASFNAAQAFTSSFIVESLDAAVSGNFDIGAILKGATFSGLSAGLTSAINLDTFHIDATKGALGKSLLGGFGNGKLTLGNILDGALDGAIRSGLSSAFYGTDFGTGFSKELLGTVVNLAMADVQGAIGDLGLKEGSPAHALLHGLAGCAAAAAQGNSCAAGMAAGVAQSLYAAYLKSSGPIDPQLAAKRAQFIGALAGYVFSEGEAANVNIAGSIAQSGIENNYLSHKDVRELSASLSALVKECGADGSKCARGVYEARLDALLKNYVLISNLNNVELANCLSRECINSHLEAAASYSEFESALRAVSPEFVRYALDFVNFDLLDIRQSDVDAARARVDMLDEMEFYKSRHCNGQWDNACQAGFKVAAEAFAQGVGDGEKIQLLVLGGIGAGIVARSAVVAAAEICGATNWICIGGVVASEAGEQTLAEFASGGFSASTVYGVKQLTYEGKIVGYFDQETRLYGATRAELEQAIATSKKIYQEAANAAAIPKEWRPIGSVGANVNTPKGFTSYITPDGDIVHVSPEGLRYGYDKKFGNRVDHVLDHTVQNPQKPIHTVFNTKGDDVLKLVDEAWRRRGMPEPNDASAFVVDMGRPIGTNGETRIRLVVDTSTNDVITAYPQ